MKILKRLWQKIRFWFWWRFIATEHQRVKWDIISKGVGFVKSGKRIDLNKFVLDEYKSYSPPNRTREKANDFADAIAYSYTPKNKKRL